MHQRNSSSICCQSESQCTSGENKSIQSSHSLCSLHLSRIRRLCLCLRRHHPVKYISVFFRTHMTTGSQSLINHQKAHGEWQRYGRWFSPQVRNCRTTHSKSSSLHYRIALRSSKPYRFRRHLPVRRGCVTSATSASARRRWSISPSEFTRLFHSNQSIDRSINKKFCSEGQQNEKRNSSSQHLPIFQKSSPHTQRILL